MKTLKYAGRFLMRSKLYEDIHHESSCRHRHLFHSFIGNPPYFIGNPDMADTQSRQHRPCKNHKIRIINHKLRLCFNTI